MSARLPAVLLLLLLITSAVHAQEAEPAWLEVADVALRLRSGPSTEDDVIAQLTPREAVQLLQAGEHWSQIRRQDGTSGWAHNDFLLPWDERNRPDTWRRVGDRRLFRVYGTGGLRADRQAELSMVSDHSYIYTVTRDSNDILPGERALRQYGEVFDQRIYQQALDLWGAEEAPDVDGDERIVILIAAGFGSRGSAYSWYSTRIDLPGEPNPDDTGFIGIGTNLWEVRWAEFVLESRGVQDLAREFGLLLHHHNGRGNNARWVTAGISLFTERYLDRDMTLLGSGMSRMEQGEHNANVNQLNHPTFPSNVPAMYFMAYVYEQLGAQTLRNLVTHPRQGLAALDALLDARGDGLNVDDFFADWAIANYLNNAQLEDGRYGYQLFRSNALLRQILRNTPIQELPARVSDHAEPYSAKYYELPAQLETGPDNRLLLGFQLSGPATQDAWLQLVQVFPDGVDLQRFRAGDYRRRPVVTSLAPRAERAFIAVSPISPGARRRTETAFYSLNLEEIPLTADARAFATANLLVRSAPEIADNTLGLLRLCSVVPLLKSSGNWSLVEGEDGLIGWSWNEHLTVLDDSGTFEFEGSCDTGSRGVGGGSGAAG